MKEEENRRKGKKREENDGRNTLNILVLMEIPSPQRLNLPDYKTLSPWFGQDSREEREIRRLYLS